ncbi:MAG: hypothetical protein V7K47_29215 [Nostoc sp.]
MVTNFQGARLIIDAAIKWGDYQYCLVKASDAINRRLYNHLQICCRYQTLPKICHLVLSVEQPANNHQHQIAFANKLQQLFAYWQANTLMNSSKVFWMELLTAVTMSQVARNEGVESNTSPLRSSRDAK